MEILWADECSAGSATIAEGVLLMLIRDIRVLRSRWLLWLSTAWTASPCFAFSLRRSGARGRLCGYAALHLSPQTLHDCVQSWTNLRYYRWALSTMSLLRTFHCSSFSTPCLTFSWYPMISYDIHEYLLESMISDAHLCTCPSTMRIRIGSFRCGSCLSFSDILGLMHSPSRPRMSARASKGLNGNHWKTNSGPMQRKYWT